jgi:hypothetical protein
MLGTTVLIARNLVPRMGGDPVRFIYHLNFIDDLLDRLAVGCLLVNRVLVIY